jgi:hypothetical protein
VIAPLNPRVGHWCERVALCLAILFLFAHTLPRAWRSLNTDFPNYYTAARLAHEGYDTSRMYEWSWIEREKDHRALDIRVIGLLPITPFSTLAIWPLAGLAPLAAKHVWILLNLVFLIPIAWMLQSMTGLGYRRIALVIFLSFPLHRNLLYGQFYILLLLLLTAACFSYLRGRRATAGVLVAIAAACKVFPLLFFVFFLQRRDWRALVSGVLTTIAAIVVSIAVFGLNAHRTWLQQILPWVMHGEGLGTYASNASISGVLHRLFLAEPQWNPLPWHSSPLLYSLLVPTLQMLALAPAILIIHRGDESRQRILLEWSAFVTVSLAISTIPASYNYVLMVFPVCVLAAVLLQFQRYGWLAALLLAYLGIGFPFPVPDRPLGPSILLYAPRLPLMLAVLFGIYALLWRDIRRSDSFWNWTRLAWATCMATAALLSVRSTLHLERSEREEYPYRLPLLAQGFLNATPHQTEHGIRYAAFTPTGYRLITEESHAIYTDPASYAPFDDLSFASSSGHLFVERASSLQSQIVDLQNAHGPIIANAHDPMLSSDDRNLAFLRDNHGLSQLMMRSAMQSDSVEQPLTPQSLNVYEASFHSAVEYAFSASKSSAPPKIYLTDATHRNAPVILEESRYPALSPDGQWMAFSRLDHGVWNLWLRNESSGSLRRIADVSCNQIQPSWETDSKTLLYSTDCGRSIWFTAISRRKVLP